VTVAYFNKLYQHLANGAQVQAHVPSFKSCQIYDTMKLFQLS